MSSMPYRLVEGVNAHLLNQAASVLCIGSHGCVKGHRVQAKGESTAPTEKGGKRARGRPKGSKTKARSEEEVAPAVSAADGVRKMLDAKKLSSKINYANLDSLFSGDDVEPGKK